MDDQDPPPPPRGFTPMSSLGAAAPPPRPGGPPPPLLDPLPRRPRRRALTWIVLAVVAVGAIAGAVFLATAAGEQEAVAPQWGFREPEEQLADLAALCREGTGIDLLPAHEPGSAGAQAALVTPQVAGLVELDEGGSGEVESSFNLSRPVLAACIVDATPLTEECLVGLAAAEVPVVTGMTYRIDVVETRTGAQVGSVDGEISRLGCPAVDPVAVPPELEPDDPDAPLDYSTALVDLLLEEAQAAAADQHAA